MVNNQNQQLPLYRQDVAASLDTYHTSRTGLTHEQARNRLYQYGQNILITHKEEPKYKKILRQFKDAMILLLIGAAVLALILGDFRTGGILLIIVIINMIIAYNQEQKAEQIMQSLQNMVIPKCKVYRDDKLEEVNTAELVPGDIVFVQEGDSVPADCRVIEEEELATNDFALTGESNPSRKFTHPIASNVILAGRQNLVFMGTTVATGNAKCMVAATGMYTELGRIADLSQNTKSGQSPLQKELNNLAYKLTVAALILSVLLILIALGASLSLKEAVIFAIGIAAAMIPQGLPAEINISLAQAAKKLSEKKALVKSLKSVETLGSTNIICTDKTGTLTENQMTIEYVHLLKGTYKVSGSGYEPTGEVEFDEAAKQDRVAEVYTKYLAAGAMFASNAHIAAPDQSHKNWYCIGDPTEGAVVSFAAKLGILEDQYNAKYKELKEFPFDSSRKMMSSVRVYDDNLTTFVKGSPESVLEACVSYIDSSGKIVPLTEDVKQQIIATNQKYARAAYRNLAVAYSYLSASVNYKIHDPAVVENNLIYIGMLSMADPVRQDVPEAMSDARQAHIKVNIITGDFAETAKAVAVKAYLADDPSRIRVISGDELDKIKDEELVKIAAQGQVIFSRVSPEDKLRIVKSLELAGYVVAVTGDGINDAPALKQANIGVAMGESGTDVAKQAAKIVLLDDSFSTLVSAVKEGRTVFQNIKKATMSCLTSNFGELLVVLIGAAMLALAGIPAAITPVLILSIDLIAELIPISALGWDRPDKKIMTSPPRNINQHIYNRASFVDLLLSGTLIGALAYANYILFFGRNNLDFDIAQDSRMYASAITLTYVTIVLSQLVNIYMRRNSGPTLGRYLFTNKKLHMAMLASLVCVAAIVYLPPLQFVFGSGSLALIDWAWAFGAAVIYFIVREIFKIIPLNNTTTKLANLN